MHNKIPFETILIYNLNNLILKNAHVCLYQVEVVFIPSKKKEKITVFYIFLLFITKIKSKSAENHFDESLNYYDDCWYLQSSLNIHMQSRFCLRLVLK